MGRLTERLPARWQRVPMATTAAATIAAATRTATAIRFARSNILIDGSHPTRAALGGTAMKTSLDHTREAALQAALAEVKAAIPATAHA